MKYFILLATFLLAPLTLLQAAEAAAKKPNFLFIYSDDHRWDAMGVVQREQGERARFPWFKSPGMDRLAAEGVRFRNAFVTLSLCAPSRAAFLTGRYNHLNGITNNGTSFPVESVTHATLLRAAGYQTAYIGKWHMGEQKGQRPGFDYSASYVGHGRYQDCPIEVNGVVTPTQGWLDDVSTDYAIDWIKQNNARPFSLVLGLKSPHNPRGGKNLPERLRELYAGETSRPTPNCGVPAIFHKPAKDGKPPTGLSDNAVHLDYLRHIRGVDENISRMLEALDALGLAEDTVVVYSSDNGFYLGEHCSGDKRSLYDESLRIPLLVRYPKLFGKGLVVDDLALNIDLAPTFLDLAGVAVPKEMQGASWKEIASGKKPAGWRQSFFGEYFKELGDVPTCYTIRTTTHKLVKYPNHPEFTEVFDLTADPYEIKNLVSDTALTTKLDAELTQLIKTVDYTVPPNTIVRDPATTKGIIDLAKPARPADAVTLVGPEGHTLVPEGAEPTKWVFSDGILTASPAWDSLRTKDNYQDFRMHVEFNVNKVEAAKDPEADGNSGIYIQQRYELQILNSFGVSEADYKPSYCGSIYRQKKPDRLVSKPAGEWQSYDIVFRAARFDGEKKRENARITVSQNGVLIHDDYAIASKTGVGEKEGPEPRPIKLQGHHNPVRFRNVWVQKLALDAK